MLKKNKKKKGGQQVPVHITPSKYFQYSSPILDSSISSWKNGSQNYVNVY